MTSLGVIKKLNFMVCEDRVKIQLKIHKSALDAKRSLRTKTIIYSCIFFSFTGQILIARR